MSRDIPVFGSLIRGTSVTGGGREERDVFDPSTGKVQARLALATIDDIDDAANAAAQGFAEWSRRTALERAAILTRIASAMRRDAEPIARSISAEQGKTLGESRAEVTGSADLLDWLAEEGKRIYGRVVPPRTSGVEQLVTYEPVGPVAAFSPWNYPLALATRKIAHALAAGCSVVIKPAEEAPSCVLSLARICLAEGVPANVLQVVFGHPPTVSKHLIESPHIRKISFTGSVAVGRQLAALAGRALKKVTFELGGHAPVIVMDDVDVERVVCLSVASKFRNAGQICIAPTRFFVQERIYDRFVDAFARRADVLRVGSAMDEQSEMGALAHAGRVEAMAELTTDALDSGAHLVSGRKTRRDVGGFFWAPTVLKDIPDSARIMREEPFGPVAPFSRFDDLASVLDRANELSFGLAGYAFTRSLDSAALIQQRLKVGMIGLNTYAATAPEMPFAGVKESGLGVAQGIEGLLDHMDVKSVFRAG